MSKNYDKTKVMGEKKCIDKQNHGGLQSMVEDKSLVKEKYWVQNNSWVKQIMGDQKLLVNKI